MGFAFDSTHPTCATRARIATLTWQLPSPASLSGDLFCLVKLSSSHTEFQANVIVIKCDRHKDERYLRPRTRAFCSHENKENGQWLQMQRRKIVMDCAN